MKINSLAVFCGSKNGNNPVYAEHAKELGKLLAKNNITLIYGGGSTGIMGAVADAMMESAGKVIGIITKKLVDWEHQHQGITDLSIVDDMHIRKQRMYDLCDAAVILPGGVGTMDEFFEMITWNQLSIHDKKIFVLNTAGFYDHLLEHIKKMQAEGFLYEKQENKIEVLSLVKELATFL